MVVDDDPDMLALMRAMLLDAGATRVTGVPDAQQAIARIREPGSDFDVVISDLNMPHVDGIQLLRQLAAVKYVGGVVLLTAEDLRILQAADTLAQAHGLHMLGVLTKPVGREHLQAVLARVGQRPVVTPRQYPRLTRREVRAAMDQGHFQAYFQPQVGAATGRLSGMESLVRWEHPEHGVIPAGAFVMMVEESELAPAITRLMLEQAMRVGRHFRDPAQMPRVSVNVPMRVLHDLAFADLVQVLADASGYPLNRLVLEITESQLMGQVTTTLDTLIRLRLKGVQLAVDDFGTGYSNMAQLKQAPISELKVDRSFVLAGLEDAQGRVILEAAITLGRNLGLRVIAEGIENQAAWDLVRDLGADEVQGDFVGAPMSDAALGAWLADWRPTP